MRVAIALLAACGAGSTPDHVPTESQPLGLNDVSILVPRPADGGTTLVRMSDGGGLVPHAVFDRLVTQPGDVIDAYEDFHLVAIRFDLCDRVVAGPCPDEDGRLRLVFQPLRGSPLEANDVGLHAFYPIPEAELGGVIDELRALAAIAQTPTTAALAVSPPYEPRE